MRKKDGRNVSRTPSPRRNRSSPLPLYAPRLTRQNAVAITSTSSTRTVRNSDPQDLQSPTSSHQSPRRRSRSPQRRRSRSPRRRRSRSPQRRRSRSPQRQS
jgi:hypothetical protein